MYSEYRGEKKCYVCGVNKATCGMPADKCRDCADALLSGRPSKMQTGNERAMLSDSQYHGSGGEFRWNQ